ncbi:MAG: aminoacyl-histidine dipeptidase [bacterium]
MSKYESLQPRSVWRIFGEICKVPHGSGNETAIQNMFRAWAEKRNLEVKSDDVGNLLISIPASKGHEKAKPLLIQGHVDMVCEKNSDTKHDFEKDPIKVLVQGDWVTADGTTLGADNGIGVAMGLAIAEEKSLVHGPVEVLLTVDEERGLTGAAGVQMGFFTARKMINLDSEEDTGIFIGCAGGRDSDLTLLNNQARAPMNSTGRKMTIKGLLGGHSGLDIDKHRGNAIKILTRALLAAASELELRIVEINGGSMRNAIPREAEAKVVVDKDQGRQFKKLVESSVARIKQEELNGTDDGLEVVVSTVQAPRCFSLESSRRTLDLLAALPNGVLAMSADIAGLVQSSSNVGVVATKGAKVSIVCCSRSSVMSDLAGIVEQHLAIGQLAGAKVEQPEGYPGWTPNLKSPLLAVTRKMYKKAFGNDPELLAIHAGLECGLLTEKYPDLDIVSFGPNIRGAHSPDEKLSVSSTQKIWKLFGAVVKELA